MKARKGSYCIPQVLLEVADVLLGSANVSVPKKLLNNLDVFSPPINFSGKETAQTMWSVPLA